MFFFFSSVQTLFVWSTIKQRFTWYLMAGTIVTRFALSAELKRVLFPPLKPRPPGSQSDENIFRPAIFYTPHWTAQVIQNDSVLICVTCRFACRWKRNMGKKTHPEIITSKWILWNKMGILVMLGLKKNSNKCRFMSNNNPPAWYICYTKFLVLCLLNRLLRLNTGRRMMPRQFRRERDS